MTSPIVLHFIETDIPGGAESMLIDLCLQQKRSGLTPMIAHFDHPYFIERCSQEKIPSFQLPPRAKFKRIASLPLFAADFAHRMRKNQIDLLHSHLFGPIVGGSLAASFCRIPHIGTLHDIHMIEDSPRRIYQLQAALLLGTRLVAVSDQMRKFYQHKILWLKDRINCIHNGVQPNNAVAVSRESLGLGTDEVVGIVVGRLVPLKRVQDAILATSRCQRLSTLLIVGAGPERKNLEALARQLNAITKVKFLGERKDVPALLKTSNFFIQCSETEGLSMSILEALHAGLPCIVTRVGGNSELVTEGHNGMLYDAGDQDALVQKIEMLAEDADIRAKYSNNTKSRAQTSFTAESCAAQYQALYSALDTGFQPEELSPP